MRTTIFRVGDLVFTTWRIPRPARAKSLFARLLAVSAAQILHALHHAPALVDAARRVGVRHLMDLAGDVGQGTGDVTIAAADSERALGGGCIP
jgi:hypothetical protein